MGRKRAFVETEKANRKESAPGKGSEGSGPATNALVENTVRSAVDALLKDIVVHDKKRAKRAAAKKKALEDFMASELFVTLAVTFKQPPFKGKLRPHPIPLKHSLFTEGEDEVCLFVKDPQRLVKDYLAEHGHAGVTRVMGVDKLRKRYKTHEGRRELLQMYDYFLVDNRVAPMMPNLLGSAFITAKKMPLSVNMRKDVVASIRRTLNSTSFCPRQGTSVSVRVARTDFDSDRVIENVMAAVDGVVARTEGGWNNIQSLNLKTNKSPALPIYLALPSSVKRTGLVLTSDGKKSVKPMGTESDPGEEGRRVGESVDVKENTQVFNGCEDGDGGKDAKSEKREETASKPERKSVAEESGVEAVRRSKRQSETKELSTRSGNSNAGKKVDSKRDVLQDGKGVTDEKYARTPRRSLRHLGASGRKKSAADTATPKRRSARKAARKT